MKATNNILDGINGPWPLPKRKQFLKDISASTATGNYELEFPKNTIRNLPIYVVPVTMPVYRLENGRTLMDQQEYIARNGKPADFFSKDPDSIEALSAQDEILKKMVDDAGLLKYFKLHQQIEPLILTGDGTVINGNRRLCAMRLLYDQNSDKYSRFGHVRIVVLPHSDQKDIAELEARLQLHQDIKADYAWISEALMYKSRQQVPNVTLADVARFYEIKEPVARERIQMLADADRYLAGRGRPRLYRELVKKEFAFKQLAKFRPKSAHAADADLFTELVFNLIDVPVVKTRRYAQIPLILKNLDKFKSQFKVEFPEAEITNSEPVSDDVGNLVPGSEAVSDNDLLAGPSEGSEDATNILDVISDPENRDRVSVLVQDIVEEAEEEKKEEDIQNACLENVCEAHTCLETAISCLTEDSKIGGVELQLTNIEEKLKQLRQKILAYAKN